MANPYEKEILCLRCGKTVIRYAPNQRYCSECSRHVTEENNRLHKERERIQRKKVKTVQPTSKPKYTIAEVNQAAKNHGMTYGKYVAAWKQGLVEPPEKFAPVKKKRKWGI